MLLSEYVGFLLIFASQFITCHASTAPLIVMSGSYARYYSKNFSLIYNNGICYVHCKSLGQMNLNFVTFLSLSCVNATINQSH